MIRLIPTQLFNLKEEFEDLNEIKLDFIANLCGLAMHFKHIIISPLNTNADTELKSLVNYQKLIQSIIIILL